MRLMRCLLIVQLMLGSPAAIAQQSLKASGAGIVGNTIDDSSALAGPPPLPGLPTTLEPSTAPKTAISDFAEDPLPTSDTGPGLDKVAPDGVAVRTVKAEPCGEAAQETDGFTTCVGISDDSPPRRRRLRGN
jgi:hypothetical protein